MKDRGTIHAEHRLNAILGAIEDAVAHVPFPLCICNGDGQILVCSDRFRRDAGPAFDQIGAHVYDYDLTLEDVHAAARAAPGPAGKVIRKRSGEAADGATISDVYSAGNWAREAQTISEDGNLVLVSLPIGELVERSAALSREKREMERKALMDPLTELPNRRALAAYLQTLDQQDEKNRVVLFHVDLDKFKLVNDTLGHDAGDAVLHEAAKILRAEVRASDFVARVGGDEFILVFTSLTSRADIEGVAGRIVRRMGEPIFYDEQYCQIGASIGIALGSDASSPEQLIVDADVALYEAKLAGRGRFSFFDAAQRARLAAFKRRIFEVREAVEMLAFEPHFQPQIDARTGEVIGLEALARWQDREAGIRPPKDFLFAIEEANLSAELDRIIITKAVKRLAAWDESGPHVARISVNLSAASLAQTDLEEFLLQCCADAGIAPSRLWLEIFETLTQQEDPKHISHRIGTLKAAGFTIVLDNFGTGSGSISNLWQLSPDQIKISGELIKRVATEENVRAITSAMIKLAHELGMSVLGEGVTTEAERALLSSLDCDRFQGYLIAKPMASEVVPIWLQDYNDELFNVQMAG